MSDDLLRSLIEGDGLRYVRGFVITEERLNAITRALYSGRNEVDEYTIRVGAPTEVSQGFLQGMADRMTVSFHKYGPITKAYPDDVDAVASLEERLKKYKETGNTEWLMDLANFAMIEFMLPRHPDAHFRATDSSESVGRMRTDGRWAGQAHNLDVEV